MNSRTQYFPTLVNKPLWFVFLFICLFLLISWSDKLVEYDRPGERWLLLTVTDVSTTCAVVIFRVKVSCITSVDGVLDHINSDDNTQPTYEMTSGFKLFTVWSGKVNFPPWKDWKAYVWSTSPSSERFKGSGLCLIYRIQWWSVTCCKWNRVALKNKLEWKVFMDSVVNLNAGFPYIVKVLCKREF